VDGYKERNLGEDWVSYQRDQPITITIPRRVALKTTLSVTVPAAYIVPAEWTVIIDVLAAHGLQMKKLAKPGRERQRPIAAKHRSGLSNRLKDTTSRLAKAATRERSGVCCQRNRVGR
jgi:hypothetical protein